MIVKVDDRRLLKLCGRDCLGYSTSIGRPSSGRSEIFLRSNLGGPPRPLSVWVAAHELGHVLGLHHRNGHDCSVMSPHAFDTRCAPSLAATSADAGRAGLRARAGGRRRRRGACTAAPRPRATRAVSSFRRAVIASRLAGFGTTIFTEMSALAERTGAINLGQGFPDEDGPAAVLEAAQAAIRNGHNQYAPLPGVPALRAGDRRAPAALLRDRARPRHAGAGDDGRDRGDHRRRARAVRAGRRACSRSTRPTTPTRAAATMTGARLRAGPAAPAGVDVRPGRAGRRDHAEARG